MDADERRHTNDLDPFGPADVMRWVNRGYDRAPREYRSMLPSPPDGGGNLN